jgi:asparagine synthase (glutamine-hydrolysing)
MPGLVGIISKIPQEDKGAALDKMLNGMMHERFYTSGTYVNEKLGLWIGWVNHQGSFSDCMPVWNETKNICLIFSGEDFRDPSEIEHLKARGHECDSGNASYLVHLYEEIGPKFIEKLNGWFSGVLVDLREQRIFVFNDRYGLGRIYYHENESGFYFSSEAKSLLKIFPELRRLDLTSLGEIFSCGCVLQNRTIFSNIALLPGGSMWIFSSTNDIQKDSYFSRELWECQPLLSGAEYYEKLKKTFARILPRYFRGRRQVGMSLTGGLDGRIILAWANCPPGELPCYTFGGTYRDCTDVKIARQVAKLCGQSHETITVDSQFFPEFPRLAEKAVFISDGTMDVTGSVELFVNRIARDIAPVRLTGNYGSEILRGNVAFRPGYVPDQLFDPEFAELIQQTNVTYQSEYQCHKVSFIAFKQVPWHHYSRISVEQSQLTMRSPYLDNDFVSLMYQASTDLALSKQLSLRLIADGNKDLARVPTDRGLLPQPIPGITKLQHQYQEFMFKAEYAYDYGMPQWMAKLDYLFMFMHFEKLFLGHHKFYHFRIWYRDKLADYIKAILLDEKTLNRPYLNRKIIEKIVKEHTKGYSNYTIEISKIITAELIHRLLIENTYEIVSSSKTPSLNQFGEES